MLKRYRLKTNLLNVFLLTASLTFGTAGAGAQETQVSPVDYSVTPQSRSVGPQVFVIDPVFTFEPILRGEKIKHTFILQNSGDADLLIDRISPSCGCTTTTSGPFTILPGETFPLDVQFDSSGKSGQQRQSILINSNDRDESQMTLVIRGEVKTALELNPSVVYFKSIALGESAKRSFEVSSLMDAPLSVVSVRSSIKSLSFEVQKKNDSLTMVNVLLDDDAPLGSLKGWVYVVTDNELDPEYHVRVLGEVVGDFSAKPQQINFGLFHPSHPLDTQVILESNSTHSHRIVKVLSENGWVDVKQDLELPHTVHVRINEKAYSDLKEGDYLNDAVLIHTSSPKQSIIRVPVIGKLRG